jgi:hypothetical protein
MVYAFAELVTYLFELLLNLFELLLNPFESFNDLPKIYEDYFSVIEAFKLSKQNKMMKQTFNCQVLPEKKLSSAFI